MRIDAKQVESPAISWAECRRERLLFRRLVLMSAMEVAALALVVFVLIAGVSLIEGQQSVGTSAMIASAILVVILIALEGAFRAARRRLAALDKIADDVPPESVPS